MTNVHEITRPAVAVSAPTAPRSTRALSEAGFQDHLADQVERREASAWSGTLVDADMTRLLSIIEKLLLPRMLQAYRPSDGLPLKRCLD